MHTLSVRTKFTFHDRIRFDSPTQGCSGVGKVIAITVDAELRVDYTIAIDSGGYSYLQPGILEEEITLLEPDTGMD